MLSHKCFNLQQALGINPNLSTLNLLTFETNRLRVEKNETVRKGK